MLQGALKAALKPYSGTAWCGMLQGAFKNRFKAVLRHRSVRNASGCLKSSFKAVFRHHPCARCFRVLSFPFLSFPFLSFPFLSCPVLSFPVLSCPVLSCPVPMFFRIPVRAVPELRIRAPVHPTRFCHNGAIQVVNRNREAKRQAPDFFDFVGPRGTCHPETILGHFWPNLSTEIVAFVEALGAHICARIPSQTGTKLSPEVGKVSVCFSVFFLHVSCATTKPKRKEERINRLANNVANEHKLVT